MDGERARGKSVLRHELLHEGICHGHPHGVHGVRKAKATSGEHAAVASSTSDGIPADEVVRSGQERVWQVQGDGTLRWEEGNGVLILSGGAVEDRVRREESAIAGARAAHGVMVVDQWRGGARWRGRANAVGRSLV